MEYTVKNRVILPKKKFYIKKYFNYKQKQKTNNINQVHGN